MTDQEFSYEKAMHRLQEIEQLMASDQIKVDDLEQIIAEAQDLIKKCKAKLEHVESNLAAD